MTAKTLTISIFVEKEEIDHDHFMDSLMEAILEKFPDAGTDESIIHSMVFRWNAEQ